MKNYILLIVSLFSGINLTYCQSIYEQNTKKFNGHDPVIGQMAPDYMIDNIVNYAKKQAQIKGFRGKWLIFDFWDKHCTSCVEGFPKINQMQQKFKDKIQFIFVGYPDKEHEIEPMFEKFRLRQHLIVPCAFDSILCARFAVGVNAAFPNTIAIDPTGVIRAWENTISEDKINDLLSGRIQKIERSTGTVFHFNDEKPFLINGNGGADTDFLYRSVISEARPETPIEIMIPRSLKTYAEKKGKIQILKRGLRELYNVAYFGNNNPRGNPTDTIHGKYWRYPILEMKDTSKFQEDYHTSSLKNLYCYSLITPPGKFTFERMQQIMQTDLKNYFGYEVSTEIRAMPYWALIATPEAKEKLRTIGGQQIVSEIPHASISAHNIRIVDVLNRIGDSFYNQIFLDETGIDSNIDISLDCTFNDFNDIQNALKTNGLQLVRKTKTMKVLVLRDGDNLN